MAPFTIKITPAAAQSTATKPKQTRTRCSTRPKMRYVESLLWILGYTRRWSTKQNCYVINGSPTSTYNYRIKALGLPKSSNAVIKTYRPAAETALTGSPEEWHLRFLGGSMNPVSNPMPASPPSQTFIKAFNERIYREHQVEAQMLGGDNSILANNAALFTISNPASVPAWEDFEAQNPVPETLGSAADLIDALTRKGNARRARKQAAAQKPFFTLYRQPAAQQALAVAPASSSTFSSSSTPSPSASASAPSAKDG